MAEANKADLQAMSQQLQDTVAASLASFARDIASQLEAVRSQKPASLDSVPQSYQAPAADVSRGDLADTSTKYSDISSDAGEMPVDTATHHGGMFGHTRTGVHAGLAFPCGAGSYGLLGYGFGLLGSQPGSIYSGFASLATLRGAG